MDAGKLNDRIVFARRGTNDDGYGRDVPGEFVDQFSTRAGLTYLRGSEAVMASRLDGRQPVVIRVYQSSRTRQVTSDWRARDHRTGETYNIRSIIPTEDRAFFDITAESGGAD